MSFTFKRMLSSLSRSDSLKSETIDHERAATVQMNGHSNKNADANGFYSKLTSETNGFSSEQKNNEEESKPKRSLSKRGKKKLSAMVSKINSSIHNNGSKSSKSIASIAEHNNNIAAASAFSDTDEDEEFSEPLCRADEFDGLLLQAEQEVDEERPRSRLSGFVNKDSSDTTATTTAPGYLESKTSEDEDNKVDILPEEDCDIPTFLHTKDCDKQLIETTRLLLRERFAKNPENFYEHDFKRMLEDDWTVSRFLLRRRCDPKRTAKLMEECGRFRKQYKMSEVQLWEFPVEFHKAGGLFMYAQDRVGNLTVYMRVRMYRRVPEISDVFKAFILCVIEQADLENKGRGVAVVFDLSGCGLQNADLGFLSWLLSSFRNYCPKGVSYILVYNLPWILSATCKLAMSWMSATNRRALRFVHGDEIENFIAKENLPDYCGGTCKINYRSVPEGSKRAVDVCDQLDITREQALKIKELFKEYLSDDDEDDDDASSKKKKKSKKNKKLEKKVAASLDAKPTDCDTPKEFHELTSRANGQNLSLDNPHLGSSANLVSQASKFIA